MVIQPGRPMDITSSDVNQQQVDGRHNGWSLICHQSSKLFFAMISQCRFILRRSRLICRRVGSWLISKAVAGMLDYPPLKNDG